jgi:GNAT superfamily N-acetyltransferase
MRFQIRPAGIQDLNTLVPLFDEYRQFYRQPPDVERARHFLRERITQHESLILIATSHAGHGLGFTQLYPLFSSVRAARKYLLNDLFVVSSVRRHGIGAALLKAAATHARSTGAASLSLSTALDNAPAQTLYESLGWQRDAAFCHYDLAL